MDNASLEGIAPVVAFHGLQGSAKTTLLSYLADKLNQNNVKYVIYNIKSTFSPIADIGLNNWRSLVSENPNYLEIVNSQEFRKKWYLQVSTFGELQIDMTLWSSIFFNNVKNVPDWVLTDDIRTPMNIQALRKLSEYRPIYLFRLLAPEEVRRSRVTVWRENAGYTELLQEPPDTPPPNFHWFDIDTTKSLPEVQETMINLLNLNIRGKL